MCHYASNCADCADIKQKETGENDTKLTKTLINLKLEMLIIFS